MTHAYDHTNDSGPVINAVAYPKILTTQDELYERMKQLCPGMPLPDTHAEWVAQCEERDRKAGKTKPLHPRPPKATEHDVTVDLDPAWFDLPQSELELAVRHAQGHAIRMEDVRRVKEWEAATGVTDQARRDYLTKTFWAWYNGTLFLAGIVVFSIFIAVFAHAMSTDSNGKKK